MSIQTWIKGFSERRFERNQKRLLADAKNKAELVASRYLAHFPNDQLAQLRSSLLQNFPAMLAGIARTARNRENQQLLDDSMEQTRSKLYQEMNEIRKQMGHPPLVLPSIHITGPGGTTSRQVSATIEEFIGDMIELAKKPDDQLAAAINASISHWTTKLSNLH